MRMSFQTASLNLHGNVLQSRQAGMLKAVTAPACTAWAVLAGNAGMTVNFQVPTHALPASNKRRDMCVSLQAAWK
jgi:hypothetical protein